MIQVYDERIENIPVLHIVAKGQEQKALPTVFFYHGVQSRKELYIHYGYLLAQRGFRVILPDAKNHGERQGEMSIEEQPIYFWDNVKTNIDELTILKSNYVARGQTLAERIGVGGVSMGAISSLGMLNKYEWIKVGVSLMGSAYYADFAQKLISKIAEYDLKIPFNIDEQIASLAPYDLSDQITRIADRPLLLWHGKKDDIVPFYYSEKLYQALTEAGLADHVEFIIEEKAKHKVSIEGIFASAAFFEKYL